jgi:hypothetical protein
VPTFDQLPAEQKAIIELVVQRGRDYDALGEALDITPSRVRELARDALLVLSPRTAKRVDPERQAQIADYLLGQQGDGEADATRAHLRRSEPGRAWANSVLDSLEDLYGEREMPEVPEADPDAVEEPPRRRERERDRPRGRERAREERERARERPRDRERARTRRDEPVRGRDLTPDAERAVRNRRIAAGVGGLLLVAALVIGLIAILGDGEKLEARTAAQPKVVGQLLLEPTERGGREQGIAIVAERGNTRDLIVQARLDPVKEGEAYEVWLYNSDRDAVSVGAQVTDRQGNYQGAGKLPAGISRYRFIDVSLEKIDNNAEHSGNSVLRGAVADMRAPQEETGPTGPGGATQGGATGGGGQTP